MEEEGARRRKYKGRGGAGTRGFLQGLNEDDEDDEEDDIPQPGRTIAPASTAATQPKKATPSGSAAPLSTGSRGRRNGPKAFELDIDGATLLGRRHKRGGLGAPSPLAGMPVTADDHMMDPGSPMRM